MWDNNTWDYKTGVQRETDGISIRMNLRWSVGMPVLLRDEICTRISSALSFWLHMMNHAFTRPGGWITPPPVDVEKGHSGLMKSICLHSRSTVSHLSQTLTWLLVAGWVTALSLLTQTSNKSERESHADENRTEWNFYCPPACSLGGMGSLITPSFQLAFTPWTTLETVQIFFHCLAKS